MILSNSCVHLFAVNTDSSTARVARLLIEEKIADAGCARAVSNLHFAYRNRDFGTGALYSPARLRDILRGCQLNFFNENALPLTLGCSPRGAQAMRDF